MKRIFFKKSFVLAAAIAGLISGNAESQDLKSALLLTKSEQYDKAEAMLQQLIQKEPSNSKYFFYLGENYLLDYYSDTISNSLEEFTGQAKEVFQKGVNANPGDPLNYIGLAKVAGYLNDQKTADEMRAKAKTFLLPIPKNIKKIVPPAQEYAFALAKIADSYIEENEVDTAAALPLIRQAVILDAKNPEIYFIAGDIFIRANDGTKAIESYNLAQFADPSSPTAYMKIGNIYMRGRSLQPAINNFEEAINLDVNYAPAYRELGQLYSSAGRLEQSKTNYQKYLALNVGNIPAQTRYVTSLFYAGDYAEVIKNIEEIFAIDKSRSILNRLAGYSSYELNSKKKDGNFDQALNYMNELFKALPESRILWKDHFYMARILTKKNQNYIKLSDDLSDLEGQLAREQSRYASAAAAAKPKLKPAVDELSSKVTTLKNNIASADKELQRAFSEYTKVHEMRPQDRAVLSELATNYYNFRQYDKAAKTWAKLIDPNNEKPEDLMQIGRAYYNGEKFRTADSVFSAIVKKSPNYVPAHLWMARAASKMDTDNKQGLARPKFDKLIQVAKPDSLNNESEMIEAFNFLGYYNMERNYNTSKDYYNRMIALNPNSKENKIKGYSGLGMLELTMAGKEKTNEGRLPFLSRSTEAYNRILALDPNNAAAKNQINYIREFEASVRKGINPNEIKGRISDSAGQPIPYASIRVKDTAAENLTNGKGEYKFEIPQSSEVLIISAKGYQTKEVPITKIRTYNVTLEK